MEPKEKDDFMYALGQTLAFFGKELDKVQFSFWYRAIGDRPIQQIKTALLDYVKVGKYAPRPANIIELIESGRQHSAQNALPPPEAPTTNCPPEIARAWMWFMSRTTIGSSMAGIFDGEKGLDQKTKERYLHIVNEQAQVYGTPDAIPDEFKLKEYWGDAVSR